MALVIILKKYMKLLAFAIFIGGLIAYFFYKDINREVKATIKKEEIITLFQTGVFKDQNNALNFANTYPSAYIYENEGYYRVIIAATYEKEATVKLESIYKSEGIEYYLKEIRVSKNFIDKIKSYEKIIIKSEKKEIINTINNSILSMLDSYIKKT